MQTPTSVFKHNAQELQAACRSGTGPLRYDLGGILDMLA